MLSIGTPIGIVVLLGMPVAMALVPPKGEASPLVAVIVAIVDIAVIGLGSLFVIRGYRLDDGGLHVERLVWANRVELAVLRRAWPDPEAMSKSLRLFGNSGFMCIAGLFTNRKLGRYRAFATDPRRAVVLQTAERTVVVTPDEPLRFLEVVERLAPQAEVLKAPPPAPRRP